MARKSKGTDETNPGDVVYTHDDVVEFIVGYASNWPKDTPKHMKEGETVTMHEKVAKTLQEKGVGKITKYLNDKRDKNLDKENKIGGPKVTSVANSVANGNTKKDEKKDE